MVITKQTNLQSNVALKICLNQPPRMLIIHFISASQYNKGHQITQRLMKEQLTEQLSDEMRS